MTKDELIEELAKRRCAEAYPHDLEWDEIRPVEQTTFRDMVREDWPLIVEFVAEWLHALGGPAPTGSFARDLDEIIVPHWRKEMS